MPASLQKRLNSNGKSETFYLFSKAEDLHQFSNSVNFSNVEEKSKEVSYTIVFDDKISFEVYTP